MRERVAVECGDFFEMNCSRKFDFIWDCTFLCALDPAVRERWAEQMRNLLADDGELLTCVFPIGAREGGPPFAMSVDLVRSLLEPVGFEATLVRDDLPLEQQHRRPGDALESVRTRGTALVSWRLSEAAKESEGGAAKRRRAGASSAATMSLASEAQQESGPLIIDTDCGLDDLATLALASASSAPLRLVTTTSGLAPHGHGHLLARRMLDRVGLSSVPVVAGAEAPPPSTVREKQQWEIEYEQRVSQVTKAMGIETSFSTQQPQREPCTAAAAARAIVDTAQEAGGDVTILALGALTNVAEAVRRYPSKFGRLIRRVIFIGDTDPSRQSYNAALDPAALQTVLGSGTEMVLVGSSCYPRPAWVEQLFGEGGMAATSSSDVGSADAGAGVGAQAEVGSTSAESVCNAGQGEQQRAAVRATATAMRALGSLDPYSMCYDPLAMLFHMQPDAFTLEEERVAVMVTGDTSTADEWRFERCPKDAREDAQAFVVEPKAVSLERYAAFLRQASL